jgi:signal transduction histidine kinase
MDELVQGLLRLTRLSYTPFPLSEIDAARLIADAIAQKEAEIREKGARVEVTGPIPRIMGNDVLFGFAFSEILSNALKFVAPGVPPRVSIRAELRDRHVRVTIQDNGIGISPEYHGRIFGIFEQLEKPENFPGLGIGLAVARKALERMEGTIGVVSRSEGGSDFWMELPAAP